MADTQTKKFSPTDVEKVKSSVKNACEYLGEVRKIRRHEPLIVASVGQMLIEKYFSKLREDDKWVILEQVFVASLETGHFELSKKCLSLLQEKFTRTSVRVRRLEGMLYEAQSDHSIAVDVYDKLLALDESDTATMKRKVCTAGSTRQDSIEALVEFLSVFQADFESWAELADLYLKEQMYAQAAFCYEELILIDPQNYHYYQKCAEIKYTIGGHANILEAIQYFTFSLELSPISNNRSLFGVCLAVNQLSGLKDSDVTKEMKATVADAKRKLVEIYQNSDKEDVKLISTILGV